MWFNSYVTEENNNVPTEGFQPRNTTKGLKGLKAARELAQEQLVNSFSQAFYALWDGYAPELPEGLSRAQYQLVLEEQANRVERFFGFSGPFGRS